MKADNLLADKDEKRVKCYEVEIALHTKPIRKLRLCVELSLLVDRHRSNKSWSKSKTKNK